MKKRKRSKRNKKILLVIILVILFFCGGYFVISNLNDKDEDIDKNEEKVKVKDIEVTLISNLDVEINSDVNLLSFIDEVLYGDIISEDIKIDTSKLGIQELEVLFKNEEEKEEKYTFNINVIDTEKPVIKAKEEFTTYVGKSIDLLDGVTVTDNSLEDIKVEIKGDYDFNKIGEYTLSYVAKDSSLNEAKISFVLKVLKDPNNYTFTTSKGYNGKVINGVTYIDNVLIVNKTYDLPSSFGNGLTSETKNAFNKMNVDAVSLGLNLYISSGYRSYYDQQYIYNNYVSIDGKGKADTYSARAGHSEHQTGLAFDLNTIDDSFTYTDEGKWVSENCYRYGLILRYPKDKESITGYMHESWHLRYVGVDLATKLYNNGNWITLEEYFGIDSKYSY